MDIRALECSGLDTGGESAGCDPRERPEAGLLRNSGAVTTTSAKELIVGAGMTASSVH